MAGSVPFRRQGPLAESFDFTGTTANPLAIGSRVTHGLATGLDWNNIQTVSAKGATGTVANKTGGNFDDNICTIAPPIGSAWGADQDLQSQVFVQNAGSFGGFHEIEQLLRFQITAHTARGYEVLFSVGPTAYIEIVRWNGAVNDFLSLANSNIATPPVVANGDYIRAVISGTTISAYHKTTLGGSWTLYAQATDTTWSSGLIGIGNWDNGAGNADDYAIKTMTVAA